ncbi:MAG: hypothetical protein PHG83_03905 [Patescibacteria group bacterium]|nr:hypothetical protein [Patescibacteria group bacterium]
MRKEGINNSPQNSIEVKIVEDEELVLGIKNKMAQEIIAPIEEIYDLRKRKEILEEILKETDGTIEKEIKNNKTGDPDYPSLEAKKIDKKFALDIGAEIKRTIPEIIDVINTIRNPKIKNEVLENIISMTKGELERVKKELEKLGK